MNRYTVFSVFFVFVSVYVTKQRCHQVTTEVTVAAHSDDFTVVSMDVVTRLANVALKMLTLRLSTVHLSNKLNFQPLMQFLTLISLFFKKKNPSLYSVKPCNISGMKSS